MPRRGRRDEDGAVLPFVAVVVVVLLLSAAMAVDLGLQRVARSDMQAVADTVALDLARELDGRDAATLGPLMPALADASRARNPDAVGDEPTLDVDLGELDDRGDFVVVAGAGVPTAVRVTARTAVDFAFAGITGVDEGGAARSAVGVAELGACFRVGSWAARLDSTTGPLLDVLLGTLLGSDVTLSLVDYQALAAADVTLLELVEVGGLGVGSVSELLELDHLAVADLYVAAARVLTDRGELAAAALLRSIDVAAGTPTIALADLVTASATDQAALAVGLDLLDLVTGAAHAAWAGHTLVVQDLGVPGLVGASLVVTEAPRVGCGGPGTRARTAQVVLRVPVTLPARTLAVPGMGSASVGATSLTAEVDLGQAVAELHDVTCGAAGATALELGLSSSVVGRVALSGTTAVSATVGVPIASDLLTAVLQVLGLAVLPAGLPTVTATASLSFGAGSAAAPYDRDVVLPLPASYSTPVGSASGVVLTGLGGEVGGGTEVRLSVARLIGPPAVSTYTTGPLVAAVLEDVVDPVLDRVLADLVDPVLSTLQTGVVAPLARLLGLQLAGADVWALREPVCGGPRLRG